MAKQRSGLHKEITSIFDGVPLPGNNGNGKGSATATAKRPVGHVPPRPTIPAPKQNPPVLTRETAVKPSEAAEPTIEKIVGPGALQVQLQKLLENIKKKVLTPKPGVSPARHMAMIVLVPVLLIIMIIVFGPVFAKSGNKTKKAKPQASTAVANKVSDKINWEIPAPYPVGLRDPMTRSSAHTGETNTSGLVVKGIVFSDNPSAVIGTQIVHRGETVYGAKVIEIGKDSVTFEKDGKEWIQKVQR